MTFIIAYCIALITSIDSICSKYNITTVITVCDQIITNSYTVHNSLINNITFIILNAILNTWLSRYYMAFVILHDMIKQ